MNARIIDLYKHLTATFQSTGAREVMEAACGQRVVRMQVDKAELDALDRLSQAYQFHVDIADYKVLNRLNQHSSWSDYIDQRTDLTTTAGLFIAYIASTPQSVQSAKFAEASDDDNELGRLLGIPSCCINAYIQFCRSKAVHRRVPFFRITYHDQSPIVHAFAGANILGVFYDACLLGHFPCSPRCHPSAHISRRRLLFLAQVDKTEAGRLLQHHRSSYLLISDAVLRIAPGRLPDRLDEVVAAEDRVEGKLPTWLNGSRIRINDEYGRVEVSTGSNWRRLDAQLIVASKMTY